MTVDPRAWWSRRWLDVVEQLAHTSRVQRGQSIARRGGVTDVGIEPGRISGAVAEGRTRPERVELRWSTPDAAAWDAATAALSRELRFTAALLVGDLPEGIEDVLAQAGAPLFPSPGELETSCTCDEESRPCRHAVALHVAVGSRFDRDPFLLLEFRGRGRDELLRALRTRRGGPPTTADPDLDLSHGLYAAHGDLDAVELRPAPVEDAAALVLHLGDPPGVQDVGPIVRLIERAAAGAWRLAAGDGAEAADEEVLLAELRAQRTASAVSLAASLGRDTASVRDDLDRLFEAGTVLRTGSGEDARYRAAKS